MTPTEMDLLHQRLVQIGDALHKMVFNGLDDVDLPSLIREVRKGLNQHCSHQSQVLGEDSVLRCVECGKILAI